MDTVAPQSWADPQSVLSTTEEGTYTTDVTVFLEANDPGSEASGLHHIEYRLNGGSWLDYDLESPPLVTQNGLNIFAHRAVDVAGNVEPAHVLTLTLDKTTYTIIPLDGLQSDVRAAMSSILRASLDGRYPLLAESSFSSPSTTTVYAAGTAFVPGEVEGSFTKQLHVGPIDLPQAFVLYPQHVAIFNSASVDERASWELPDVRRVLETYPQLHEWPLVDEVGIASNTLTSDVLFFPAGVTLDVLNRFQETGAAGAVLSQAQSGRWFVFQGDACRLAEVGGLVPPGTVGANALEPGRSALVPVASESILTYNWPEELALTRYSDVPRFHLSDDLVQVADYADNGETAIVMRRVGNGGVILIGGHPALDTSTYGLLFNALFTAAAERVNSQVALEQQFMPGMPPDLVPGFEPDVPLVLRTTVANHSGQARSAFVHTEIVTNSYMLHAPPTVTLGATSVTSLPTGTLVIWSADVLPSGEHQLTLHVANVNTDTLKPGDMVVSQADVSYVEVQDGVTRTVGVERADAVVRAMAPPLVAHNLTDEPDNVYPFPSSGLHVHHRHDLENKLETRANNLVYTVTLPYFDILRDAYDQTIFPHVEGSGENVWMKNEIYGYPERNYPLPEGATDGYWYYTFEDWDCSTWVRIPNPHRAPVSIPDEIQHFAYQEEGNGDVWVAGITLAFELDTLLPYDYREPAVRYLVHSQELFGRDLSFSVEPVTDTLVLEGNGGSVYTAVGQDPIPFREVFPDAAINNPVAPVPSEITYTDLWGRTHTVTETVRSSFYDIIPYDRTGDAVDVRFASTYGLTGESGERLFDFPTYQVVTLTLMLRAESTGRNLSADQLIIQEMLPRGLGYDVEFVTWQASNGSFRLLDEYTMHVPAFDLLTFQGDLPEDEPQTILITARLRTYPLHPREGSFLVDGGAAIATQNEWGDPNQFDTAMTHVRVEQGYQASLQVEKWVSAPDISRHGGHVYEAIRADGTGDVQSFVEEVYIDATGTVDKAAVVRTGMSRGPNLYFGTTAPGGETMMVLEVTNNSGDDWTDVVLAWDSPPGITLTPILTDGLEPPPNVYDTPYLWATEIPDVARGVYYFQVHVDEAVEPGVMYPIHFTLSGTNVPPPAEFPLPVGRVGVGGPVQRTLGQAHAIELSDTAPVYAEPDAAALVTSDEFAAFQTLTDTVEMDAFFAALTRTVPFTFVVPPSSTTRYISYTIPAEWQTLPRQEGTALHGEWYLLVRTQVAPLEPGSQPVNYGPIAAYVDDFGAAWAVEGNATHVIAHGPALTGTYSVLSITSPFYGGDVVDPLPGEEVDVCIDIAVRNMGNHVAFSPVVSTTVVTDGVTFLGAVPTPTSVISGVVIWEDVEDILPYGASDDPEVDVAHFAVCLRFTPPEAALRLMMLEDPPFYVPLIEESRARYVDAWAAENEVTIHGLVGSEYGIHVGRDPLSAPDLYSAVWNENHTITLNWWPVEGAVDYVVYRSTEPDRNFRRVGPVTNGTTLTDIIWEGPPLPVYYYVVRARDANQFEGRHSQVVAVYTGSLPQQIYLPLVLRQ
jgi:hypothetical protein